MNAPIFFNVNRRWLFLFLETFKFQIESEGVGEFGLSSSVTRFGEISPLWQNFKRLLQMLKGPLSIWRI